MPGDWSGGKTGGKTSSEAGGKKSSVASGSIKEAPAQAALGSPAPKAKSAKRSVLRAKRRLQERMWELRERHLAAILGNRNAAMQRRSPMFDQE